MLLYRCHDFSGSYFLDLKVLELLFHKRTEFQEITIAKFDRLFRLGLCIDGRLQSCDTSVIDYHSNLILGKARPSENGKALVLGAGEGITTDMLLKKGYDVTAIDIDPDLIDAATDHLGKWSNDIYKRDDEFELVIDDALVYIEKAPHGEFEYIVFDLTEPTTASQQAYTHKFIFEIFRILPSGGILSCQDGSIHERPILKRIIEDVFKMEPFITASDDWRFTHIVKQ